MAVAGFWALLLLAAGGAVKALSVIFPRTWDALIEAWGVPERDR